MSKELEALGLVKRTCELYIETTRFLKGSDIIANQIKEALNTIQNRLESIDNANPSEALECLEDIYRNGVFISEVSFTKQHPIIRSPETNKTIGEQCDTIKQALLKVQEPKHYLKWEDLEFDREEQTMKVSLNGHPHLLCYYRTLFGSLCMIDNTGITIREDNKYFFNDLHLERVE